MVRKLDEMNDVQVVRNDAQVVKAFEQGCDERTR